MRVPGKACSGEKEGHTIVCENFDLFQNAGMGTWTIFEMLSILIG
jgi:hypothetical protein